MAYITKKTNEEVKIMAEGGRILSDTLKKVIAEAKPGSQTAELDSMAKRELESRGAVPSFLNYKPVGERSAYPCSLCVSINQEVVHGLAVPNRVLNEGDLVSFDIGAKYRGLYTDMAATVFLGRPSGQIKKLLKATRQALVLAIKAVKPGNNLTEIGRVIESHASGYNFGVVRDLVGHGVGYAVHEPPRVPNYEDPSLEDIILEPGMCLAIEPMVTLGTHNVKTLADDWTIVTADNSLSAHFEVTVAVTGRGRKVLTPFVV
jgi:methionyl aminopeptidase